MEALKHAQTNVERKESCRRVDRYVCHPAPGCQSWHMLKYWHVIVTACTPAHSASSEDPVPGSDFKNRSADWEILFYLKKYLVKKLHTYIITFSHVSEKLRFVSSLLAENGRRL